MNQNNNSSSQNVASLQSLQEIENIEQKFEKIKQRLQEKVNESICSFKNEEFYENQSEREELQNINDIKQSKKTHNKSTGQNIELDELKQDSQVLSNKDQNSYQSSQVLLFNSCNHIDDVNEKENYIGSYYSKNQDISVIIEMEKDQEDEKSSYQEASLARRNSDFSKYTNTYVLNQNDYISNSSQTQGSLINPNRFKNQFSSQSRSRKSKRNSILSQVNDNRQVYNQEQDSLTVIENIIDDQETNLLQPCIISNRKQVNSNFKNILSQSDLVNLKDEEKQEFLEFLIEENEKELENDLKYEQMQNELYDLDEKYKIEKELQKQELDNQKLQIWIIEDKIVQMNEQYNQIKDQNDQHSEQVKDIKDQINSVKLEIQNKEQEIIHSQKDLETQKIYYTQQQIQKERLLDDSEKIKEEYQEEQQKLKIIEEQNLVSQLLVDETTVKQQECQNKINELFQNQSGFDIQVYKIKKEISKIDEDILDFNTIYERNLQEQDMFETQHSFYLKQQSILLKDIDILNKKKLFHQEFIYYGDKNNKQLFKIIEDNFLVIDNLNSSKKQFQQEIQQLNSDNTNQKTKIDLFQIKIQAINKNLDNHYNLAQNKNSLKKEIIQIKDVKNKDEITVKNSCEKKIMDSQRQEEGTDIKYQYAIVKYENMETANKIQCSSSQMQSSRLTITQNIQSNLNSKQPSTCHTRSQTVIEDEFKNLYENIKKNIIRKVDYQTDEPITYRETIKQERVLNQNLNVRKSAFINDHQYQSKINQKEDQLKSQKNSLRSNKKSINQEQKESIQKKQDQLISRPQIKNNQSPFDLSKIFQSQNNKNDDIPLAKMLQNCEPLNQKQAKNIKNDSQQQIAYLKNIFQTNKENQMQNFFQENERIDFQHLNLNYIMPLRKSVNNSIKEQQISYNSTNEKQNIMKKVQKLSIGKQLNKFIDDKDQQNKKSRFKYDSICQSVKNIIKKSDKNHIFDKKPRHNNKSSENSIANISKCSTHRQNIDSERELNQKKNMNGKQNYQKNQCMAKFVNSQKYLTNPNENQKKQKLTQFIQKDKMNENIGFTQTGKQKSLSQSFNSTQMLDKFQIHNSLPFKMKQEKSLNIQKHKFNTQLQFQNENIKKDVSIYDKKFNANQISETVSNSSQLIFKSKTAQRLIQQKSHTDGTHQIKENQNNNLVYNMKIQEDQNAYLNQINKFKSLPLRRSLTKKDYDIKQKYTGNSQQNLSTQKTSQDIYQKYGQRNLSNHQIHQKSNEQIIFDNINTPKVQNNYDKLKYSKFIKPLRQKLNYIQTLYTEAEILSPKNNFRLNQDIEVEVNHSQKIEKNNNQLQNFKTKNFENDIYSPKVNYKIFQRSTSSNILTYQNLQNGLNNLTNQKQLNQFEFKSKFAKQSFERKIKQSGQSLQHQEYINEIFQNENQQSAQNKKPFQVKILQQSYVSEERSKPKSNNTDFYNQFSQKQSQYQMEILNKSSLLSDKEGNCFNKPHIYKESDCRQTNFANLQQPIKQQMSSIDNKTSHINESFENTQNHLLKIIQKEFTSQGELNLKSNFAKRNFEKHIEKKSSNNMNILQQETKVKQYLKEQKHSSPSAKQKSKNSKLSQFLQPVSKCDDNSSRTCDLKNLQFQEKMQKELKILQAQIQQEVKQKQNSPKQPKSALIGRKKGKIEDEFLNLSGNLYEQIDIHESHKVIPISPNDFMQRHMPLNMFENENLRNKKCEMISEEKQRVQKEKESTKDENESIEQKSYQECLQINDLSGMDMVLNKKSFDSREDDLNKIEYQSEDSHISLKDQDEIISQLKSNKELNYYL